MDCTIDGIQVQNFRGIRRINLPVNGRNLIIVGENGAGKSSIVDAIEYFFTGRIAPLEGRSDVNKNRSIPNLKGGPTAVKLTLHGMPPETGIALPYPRRTKAVPPALKPVADLAKRRSFVLRRSQILSFVNARDAERYKEVSQLIGLGRLDRMDDCWRQERNSARKRMEGLQGEQQRILGRLGELLHTKVRNESAVVRAVNQQLDGLGLPRITERKELVQRRKTLQGRTRLDVDEPKAERLKLLQESSNRIVSIVARISSQHTELEGHMLEFWAQSEILADAPFELLLCEGSRSLQEQPELAQCPLCGEPFRDKTALLADLHNRLEGLQDLAQGRRRIGELEASIQDELLALNDAIDGLSRSLADLGMTTYLPVIQQAREEASHYQRQLGASDWRSRVDQEWQTSPTIKELLSVLPELDECINEQMQELAPTEAEKTALDWLVRVTQVDEQWQTLDEIAREIEKAKCVAQQVGLVYDELIAARKRGLERLRQELEEDFDRLYQQMHPDEGYEAITIPVQHDRRSSVALRAKAFALEAHPLGHFSEGHLDSLGLCIFLAFIKHFNQDLKLIVLDDVLTTVDAGHRLRVARLLAREFSDYQLVLTTHDQLWANELRSTIPRAKLVQLRKWTIGQGVDYQDNVLSDWDYYAQQAADGRPQDTIGGAGRNLEKLLYQMRGNLGLAVPAKPDRDYSIGDLYDPFWAWINRYQPERPDRPDFVQELRELKQELDEVWRLRNWSGAHFNAWAETVTPAEALDFLHAIERLVTSFECPVCRNLVVYRRAAKALICPNCQPCPPPQAVCEYQPGWDATCAKLLQATRQKVRRQATGMAQSVCRAFLRDMRRHLNLTVLATPDDQYDLPELYSPFFEWAMAHPKAGMPDWEQNLSARKDALDAYWRGEAWANVGDTEIVCLVDAVQQLTTLFACNDCSQLLSYDHELGTYFCPGCTKEETIQSTAPAYWFLRKG